MNDLKAKETEIFNYYKLLDEKKHHYLQSLIIYFSVLTVLLPPLFAAIANYYYKIRPLEDKSINFEIFSALSAIIIVILFSFLIYGAFVFRVIIYLSAESHSKLGLLKNYYIIKYLEWTENTNNNFWIVSLLNSVSYFFLYFIITYFPIVKSKYENNFLMKIFNITNTTPWAGYKLFLVRFLFGVILMIIIFCIYRAIAYFIFKYKIKNK